MEEDINLQRNRLQRRVAELEKRIENSRYWTNGELEIFRIQIKAATLKLEKLNHI